MPTSPVPVQLFTKVRAFLLAVMPAGTEVVQGLGNRVPPPASPFVTMTLVGMERLATNEDAYTDPYQPGDSLPVLPGERAVRAAMQVRLQLDFFGPDAAVMAVRAETFWRDELGCDLLAPECQPLHADTARMVPWVPASEQYVERWMVEAQLQWSPVSTLDQQFAGTLEVDPIIEVDTEYPP